MKTVLRKERIQLLQSRAFDLLILGGGATGAATALDASRRGYSVALIDKQDFSQGTSSRSTKLIHGGVRYLAQFHFKLIHEALTERKTLLQNAPHLVHPLPFVLPTYSFYEKPYFSIGMTMYDLLAGTKSLPAHKRISKTKALELFPSLKKENLKGGILYYDAGFNDSRLNIATIRGAESYGAMVCNRIEVVSFLKTNGKITGIIGKDILTQKKFTINARAVANTTGVWIDEIRKLDDPNADSVLQPSQGIHLVFDPKDLPCQSALIIPKTSDGRVVFLIPWEGKVLLGTTDTAIQKISQEPMPEDREIDFLLETGNSVLDHKLTKSMIKSVFSGLRPLIGGGNSKSTKSISREEAILESESGLITMSGGKWSTFRKMGEDLTDRIQKKFDLAEVECTSKQHVYVGGENYDPQKTSEKIISTYKVSKDIGIRLSSSYGTEVFDILGKSPKELKNGIFKEEILHFINKEYANSTLDILARRLRILFLDLDLSLKLLQPIHEILANQLKWNQKEKEKDKKEALGLLNELQSHLSGRS